MFRAAREFSMAKHHLPTEYLRLLITVLILFHFRYETSDALLELAVLGCVDERVNSAVGERQCHTSLIEESVDVDFPRNYVDIR